jgi:hypothetical protein
MPRVLVAAVAVATLALVAAARPADAAPKKKYHFELVAVTLRSEVKADVGGEAQPRVESLVTKAFESHPQLVSPLDGNPDPAKTDAYHAYLRSHGLAGSYRVTVEITDARFDVETSDKPNTARLVAHIGLHMLGEVIPEKTMGFTGDGQATIKAEVAKNFRASDRSWAWDQAAELAVADAIKTSIEQLEAPKKK